ncbi:MAG: BMP family ABC transporter substrate-binding protein [Lachnospiraceae bacterium]|nr:BMP family ABC transporter substrate-binding protein [Lachnospiraceae bacterium]
MAMKKIVSVLLAAVMTAALCACQGAAPAPAESSASDSDAGSKLDIKAGFICLHDENSTYDLNFITGAKAACEKLGVEAVIKTNIPEGQECYDAACELVDQGCGYVFADSFGHEDYMIEAAKEYPEVQFCHATGTKAHTENLPNFHNAFASIYEGRYLSGIAAGMKLNQMIEEGKITAEEAKIGYVGAFTYAEVISGYTSYFLGARSVCPTATMEVTFTGSWYDETAEKEGATKLISDGCVFVSQHADSMGAPTACENAGVPNSSYNGPTDNACPETYISYCKINWEPYFEDSITKAAKGEAIATDYTGTLETGSVVIDHFGKNVAPGTEEAVEAAKADIIAGKVHVFDTKSFTVDGQELTSYMADVDTDANYEGDHEVIKDGYFNESGDGLRSAPYFDLQIDGITLLDTAF